MDLSDKARHILSDLAMAKGNAYLFGKRDGETPFSIVDKAARTRNQVAIGSPQVVGRNVVLELTNARLVQDDACATETFTVALRISEKGRRHCAN
jgi:hypothetical protein